MVTGFSECIDSFFAFGLFALARAFGIFPPAPRRYVRAGHAGGGRHIIFFINWVAGTSVTYRYVAPLFAAKVARGLGLSWFGADRHRTERRECRRPPHRERCPRTTTVTLTGSKAVGALDLSVATLIDVCLEENERRLSGYDGRLLRPNLVAA